MPETLGQFIGAHREELLLRCRAKVATRPSPPPTDAEIERGIPQFLDDITGELSGGPSKKLQMARSATQHGVDLFSDGFTVSQVVHDYGAVCQSVTDLAVELGAPISTEDFRTLNRCLDDSIASAVSAYGRQKQPDHSLDQSITLRNLITTAMSGFEVLQSGKVGIDGSTGRLVHRCLLSMVELTSNVR
jgi:hypothetical protein